MPSSSSDWPVGCNIDLDDDRGRRPTLCNPGTGEQAPPSPTLPHKGGGGQVIQVAPAPLPKSGSFPPLRGKVGKGGEATDLRRYRPSSAFTSRSMTSSSAG